MWCTHRTDDSAPPRSGYGLPGMAIAFHGSARKKSRPDNVPAALSLRFGLLRVITNPNNIDAVNFVSIDGI